MTTRRRKIAAPPEEERPFTVALSQDEIVALIRFHTSQARRVTKAYGQQALVLQSKRPFNCSRDLQALGDVAKGLLEAHTRRAKGLMSILPR